MKKKGYKYCIYCKLTESYIHSEKKRTGKRIKCDGRNTKNKYHIYKFSRF
jgi:hypothetical protein